MNNTQINLKPFSNITQRNTRLDLIKQEFVVNLNTQLVTLMPQTKK